MSKPAEKQSQPLDAKQQAQIDLEIYQNRLRTYKQLENDIKTFQDEMHQHFKKQQQEVQKFEADNKRMTTEAAQLDQQIQKQLKSKHKDSSAGSKLLTEIQSLKEKYERESQQSLQLDNQIQLLQTEIIEQKRLKGGSQGAIAAQNEGAQ